MSEGTTVFAAYYLDFFETLNFATDGKWSVVDAAGPGCATTSRTGVIDREAPGGTCASP